MLNYYIWHILLFWWQTWLTRNFFVYIRGALILLLIVFHKSDLKFRGCSQTEDPHRAQTGSGETGNISEWGLGLGQRVWRPIWPRYSVKPVEILTIKMHLVVSIIWQQYMGQIICEAKMVPWFLLVLLLQFARIVPDCWEPIGDKFRQEEERLSSLLLHKGLSRSGENYRTSKFSKWCWSSYISAW